MKQMKDLKRFSKEWWVNYWFYYKIHTIASIFVLALIIGTIVDVVTRVKPDVEVMIASQQMFSDEQVEEMKAKMSEIIDDVNNDGQKSVLLTPLNIAKEGGDEMQIASRQKLDLEFAAGDTFVFFLDKHLFELYNQDSFFIELGNGQSFIPANEVFDFMNEDTVLCIRVKRMKEKADYTNAEKLMEAFTKRG